MKYHRGVLPMIISTICVFTVWGCAPIPGSSETGTSSFENSSLVSSVVSYDETVISKCDTYSFGVYELSYKENVLRVLHNGESVIINPPEGVVPTFENTLLDEHRIFFDGHILTEYLQIIFDEDAKYGGDGYTDVTVIELNHDGSFSDGVPTYFNLKSSIDEDFFLEGLQIKESGTFTDKSGKYTILILKDGEETMTVHASYQNWEPVRFSEIRIAYPIYDDDYWAIGAELIFPDQCHNPETDDFLFGVAAYVSYKDGQFQLSTNTDGTPYVEVDSYGSGC